MVANSMDPPNMPRNLLKPEPRDLKQEFETYLRQITVSNAEYGALLATMKQMVFEREQSELLGFAINHNGDRESPPRLLHYLRLRHDKRRLE